MDAAGAAAESGGADEMSEPPSGPSRALSITNILEKLARRSAQPPGDMPLPLRAVGLSPFFWAALDAKGRHWLKRRLGAMPALKLACKAAYMALQQVQGALASAGVERDMDELMDAVEDESAEPLLDFRFGPQDDAPAVVYWRNLRFEPGMRKESMPGEQSDGCMPGVRVPMPGPRGGLPVPGALYSKDTVVYEPPWAQALLLSRSQDL